ncbi:hypothetical protein [Clostridiisalibacter paucivorans]|nr:hypothetical protein [Clostridiisalibacter paucivorans]
MEMKNKLNEVPLANMKPNEVNEIKDLEKKLDNKYYIIAFKK